MMHHFDPARALELIDAGAGHHVRRRPDHGHAGPRLARLRQVRHFVHPQRVLRRRARTSGPGAADPGGLAGRAAVQRLRPDRDVLGDLHEHRPRLRRQARQRRSAGSRERRRHRPRGLHRRRAGRLAPPRPRGAGRTVDQGPPGGTWLLEPTGRDGAGLHAGLAPHRRYRPARCGQFHLHRRSGQGHDHPGRRERLLGAGRSSPVRAPRRGRLRRDRHP